MSKRSFKKIILQEASPTLASGQRSAITLQDIFNYMADGKNDKAIFRADPRILPETIEMARIFLQIDYPRLYASLPSPTKFRLLIDENISPSIKKYLPKCFEADHVSDVGLVSEKDPVVMYTAFNRQYDGALTCDKRVKDPDTDLTLIVYRIAHNIIAAEQKAARARTVLKEMPVLLHYRPNYNANSHLKEGQALRELEKIFRRHASKICAQFGSGVSPTYELSLRHGITPGKTYAQMVSEGWWDLRKGEPFDRNTIIRLPRVDRWKEKWRNIILKNHKGEANEEEIVRMNAMLDKAAKIGRESLGRTHSPDFLPPGRLPP